jgi:mRNA interferase MazF
VIVSRQALIDSNYSTVICAPVFSEGLKHDGAIHCDGLMSIEKSRLTDYVGELSDAKQAEVDKALQVALALPTASPR